MTSAPASPDLPAADQVGAATLERMARADAYNRWMYDRLASWIGRRIIEIGSGIGNMSQFLVGRERLVLTDTEPAYRAYLQRRFADVSGIRVTSLTLPAASDSLISERFDTVVCLNVLEHIADDRGSLAAIHRLLQPGGRLVLLVPALPGIYGTLDRQLGHQRRYTPRLLRERYAEAGFRLLRLEYFNLAGVPGWWFTGRVLKRDLIPTGGLALFDALVPLFRLERLIPWRVGQSLIAIGEKTA
ncbi:MAG: class I SAM-dependent methyltransferase [Gemmatimonadetes bacterium]|nr:class I SAM-dependent methyltransferase [Gemmatimonadota bacterium]